MKRRACGCPVVSSQGRSKRALLVCRALVGGGEGGSELLDLLVAEGRNEAVDVELLDGALDDALDNVVEAEAVHEATDGAGVQVEDAGRVALAANNATDSAGSETKNITGLTLDNTLDNVVDVKAVGKATGGAGLQAEDAGRVTLAANNTANGAGSKAKNIAGLALDHVVEDGSNVKALGEATGGAGSEVEGLVRVAVAANDGADGTRAKVKGVARVTLDDVVDNVVGVQAVGKTTNEAGVETKGLVSIAVVANDRADGTGAKVEGVTGVTLDDVADSLAKVEAVGQATDEARVKTKSLVGVAAVAAEDRASSTRAKVEGVARVALDDVVDGVSEVKAVG
jgi:hypothetical protein